MHSSKSASNNRADRRLEAEAKGAAKLAGKLGRISLMRHGSTGGGADAKGSAGQGSRKGRRPSLHAQVVAQLAGEMRQEAQARADGVEDIESMPAAHSTPSGRRLPVGEFATQPGAS